MAKKKGKKGTSRKKGAGKRGRRDEKARVEEKKKTSSNIADGEMVMPTHRVQYVKPKDQLTLSETELKIEHERILTWSDPNFSSNSVRFDFSNGGFTKQVTSEKDQVAIHFSSDGDRVFRGTEEGECAAELKAIQVSSRATKNDDEDVGDVAGSGEDGPAKNQFKFSERACQTYNAPMRDFGISTCPPKTESLVGSVTQWKIYDAYLEEFKNVKREEEIVKRLKNGGTSRTTEDASEVTKSADDKDEDIIHSAEMGRALKVLERMVNQNCQDEIYQDFKYWEDVSDNFREGEGSLLPLWRFSSDHSKHKHVTSIAQHPHFADLFAVGFGSYSFMQQGSGLIHCYSLKNSASPEYAFTTESGVMCLDFHPQHHSLLCVGCYDGTVLVFDVRSKNNRPIYRSTIKTGKHTDPVFQVMWQEEDLSKVLNFHSVSLDGRVANWLMSNSELKMETLMELKLMSSASKELEEDMMLTGLAGGTCFDFNAQSEHLFVVGTEEGSIHKCSKAYSGTYLETYEGHHMIVYSVSWNKFHPDIFISCSADWTVKIWDHASQKPLMTFDLGDAVGDVKWSPYSSTVFCAVTNDGKARIFDLSVNKHEPICEQKILKRSKLTKVSFNKTHPIISCGDERGSVVSLKLSPNVRKHWKVGPFSKEKIAEEAARLTAILSNVDVRPEEKTSK